MRFIVFAVILVTLAGFFHIMFIMFDNAWYNDDNGVFTVLPETLNSSLDAETQNSSWNRTIMLRDAFGYARVICLGLVFSCLILEAIDKPRIQG